MGLWSLSLLPTNSQSNFFISTTKTNPKSSLNHSTSLYTNKSIKSTYLQACLQPNTTQQVRPLAHFPSNIWTNIETLTSNIDDTIYEFNKTYGEKIEELKDYVKEMLIGDVDNVIDKVIFIDTIFRLGISYYFEDEMKEQLDYIFESQPNLVDYNDIDLYTTAAVFRIFREQRYPISSDCFNKFKDIDGKFQQNLRSDRKGMLALYEAAYLRFHEEDILKEALDFTMIHLKILIDKSSPHLAKQIINALETPLYRGDPREETIKYIGYYEDDEFKDDNLLLFAKLDFNRVQLLYRRDIAQLESWWKDLDISSKLPYVRVRIIESFYWANISLVEPCYSLARLILSKINVIFTLIDDTFDAYAHIHELRSFTSAFQSWNLKGIDDLSDNMKVIHSSLVKYFDETSRYLNPKERAFALPYAKEAAIEMICGYLVEAEWRTQNYVPPVDEQLKNSHVTAGCYLYTAAMFLGMGVKIDVPKAMEWLQTKPQLCIDSYLLARLMNDLVGHKIEHKRTHVASSIQSYMEEHGSSEEEASKAINQIIENCWVNINEEFMKSTDVPKEVLIPVIGLARLGKVTYKKLDGYTNPQEFREIITKLYFTPISI